MREKLREYINDLRGNKKLLSIVTLLVILTALPLTVVISQHQQEIRQRAAEIQSIPSPECRPPYEGYLGCLTENGCKNVGISSHVSCSDENVQIGVYCYKTTKQGQSCSANGNAGTCDDNGNCLTSQPPQSSTAYRLRPHVYILEDDEAHTNRYIDYITKKFYEKYPDQYDFISIHFKNWNPDKTGTGFVGIKDTTQGNFQSKLVHLAPGQDYYEWARATYGASGKLLGIVIDRFDFNKVYVERDPNNDAIGLIDNVYFSLLFHELTHYWGLDLPDELKEANHYNWNTKEYDRTHWELFVGSWVSNGHTTRYQLIQKEGKYYLKKDCSKEPKHHDFDLYSMGLKSSGEIKDKLVIIKPYNELPYGPSASCDTSIELSKDFIRKIYTIQDFINVFGPRIPSVANSQKDFTIAFVMVVPKGETLNQKQIDALNWIADKFPVVWYKSTEGRSTLNGIKPEDTAPPIISNVKTSVTKSSIKISWATNEPASSFVIYTRIIGLNPLIALDYIAPQLITNPPKFVTSHEITINNGDWTPISANTEYPVKIISIDEDYNMASFDAGKLITSSSP